MSSTQVMQVATNTGGGPEKKYCTVAQADKPFRQTLLSTRKRTTRATVPSHPGKCRPNHHPKTPPTSVTPCPAPLRTGSNAASAPPNAGGSSPRRTRAPPRIRPACHPFRTRTQADRRAHREESCCRYSREAEKSKREKATIAKN